MHPGWDVLGGPGEAALLFLLLPRTTLGVWLLSLTYILAERLLCGERLLRKSTLSRAEAEPGKGLLYPQASGVGPCLETRRTWVSVPPFIL